MTPAEFSGERGQALGKIVREYEFMTCRLLSPMIFEEMKDFYDRFDCLINCSLRDSGCFIVMEAMSRGLPLICVNTGGPKINTTNECKVELIAGYMYSIDVSYYSQTSLYNLSITTE